MSRDYEDKVLESQLRDALAGELDAQLGRSKRAFRDHVVRMRINAPVVIVKTSTEPKFRAKFWTIAASGAIAAALAAFWIVPKVLHHGQSTTVTSHVQTESTGENPSASAVDAGGAEWEEVEKVVSSMTVDDGLFLIDNRTPVRMVRQVEMERKQWIDQRRGVSIETVVPRQDTQLIQLDTY